MNVAAATVVDTNLSVLLIAGMCGPRYISSHKRLQAFGLEDYQLLRTTIDNGRTIVLFPNVLTETSNLLRQIAEPMRGVLMSMLGQIVLAGEERFLPSRQAVVHPTFLRLGLTDAAILEFLRQTGSSLITADLGLYLAALDQGSDAENFNHIRDASFR